MLLGMVVKVLLMLTVAILFLEDLWQDYASPRRAISETELWGHLILLFEAKLNELPSSDERHQVYEAGLNGIAERIEWLAGISNHKLSEK